MESQNKQILNHLQSGRSITPVQALIYFGCFRLAARIYFLRQKEYNITTEIKKTTEGKSYALYRYAN